jgi:hypothetical protein
MQYISLDLHTPKVKVMKFYIILLTFYNFIKSKKIKDNISYPLFFGAGDENRTHVTCLEGKGSTIELHPHNMERKTGLEPATFTLAR